MTDDLQFATEIFGMSWTDKTHPSEVLTTRPITVQIQSFVSQLWLPLEMCQSFEEAFGLEWDSDTDLYLVNQTLHDSLLSRNITVNITVGNRNSRVTLDFPYSMFDLSLGPLHTTNVSHYFPIRRAANSSQYILGRTFLQRAYITADYDRNIFNLSRAVYSNSTENRVFAITPPPNSDVQRIELTTPKKLTINGGSIAGITIGTLAFSIMVGIFLLRQLKRNSMKGEIKPDTPHLQPEEPELEGQSKPQFELEARDNEKKELQSIDKMVELEGSDASPVELPGFVPIYELKEGRDLSYKEETS
jgi:hypothetical protein